VDPGGQARRGLGGHSAYRRRSSTPDALPLQKLKENKVGVMVVHGDADRVAPVESSRLMSAEMKKLGVECQYIEVPGGSHGDVVGPNLQRLCSFSANTERGIK